VKFIAAAAVVIAVLQRRVDTGQKSGKARLALDQRQGAPFEFRGPTNLAAGRFFGEIRGDRKPLSRVSLLQRRRNQRAALRPMRKLLRKQGFAQKLLTPHKLGSYITDPRFGRPLPAQQR
jgi:hypothetical protein